MAKRTAKRAASSTSVSPTQSQENGSILAIVSIILTLFGLDLARSSSQLALHPLFGSVGSNQNFERSVQIIDFVLVPLTNFLLPALVPSLTASSFLAAFLVWRAPHTFGSLLSDHSGRLGLPRGPLIFQSLAYWPIRITGISAGLAVAVKFLKQYAHLLGASQRGRMLEIICTVSLPLVLHGATQAMIPWANRLSNYIPPCQIFDLTPACLLAIGVVSSIVELFKPNRSITKIKRVNGAIVWICIVSAFLLPLPKQLCQESDGWKIKPNNHVNYLPVARRLSTTGMILVGELTQDNGSQFRFMRCDHSLLGGIWIGMARQEILKRSDQSNITMTEDELEIQAIQEAESIYPTFILQSAVRLVARSSGNQNTRKAKPKALILGVGVGVSARVLMKDGVNVTAVEIDPIVYEYAQKYFGFPVPEGGIFLEDARAYLNRKEENDREDPRFDYVIHDVFTGGSVPSSLFTIECWNSIRSKLKDDGVLAVNFVGRPLSEAASFVLTTLFEVFPFCRAFSEDSGVSISDSDYQNMVIFCSPSGPPQFRKPTEIEGFEPSIYQSQVLSSFEDHELDLGRLSANHNDPENTNDSNRSFVLTDLNSYQLDLAQVQNALFHWEIMRKILPHQVWNNYYY
ncbi:hypothetical protein Pst134EA_022507 [Puccinia striiformis f. sp. tritici]|uniref:hypothetical protein n=1 Tax=Puccinia striiformis f. sp. tritici TaxID=168172 RepID=UPI0020086763|nr:hypothetical protein Pst134EA_022507 [Puccinia striiformis f. sp. tritici]KAH9455029.1 hypothetical protein Pst134EA_022507 [Puccinia striiformis f. sp. tritici]